MRVHNAAVATPHKRKEIHGIMFICFIITPLFLGLSLAGIIADIIAPKYPKMEERIYAILDSIM